MRPAGAAERWVALFLLAVLLFSPPFLSIVSDHQLLSLPFIYVYLFLSWGLVILLLALAAEGGSLEAKAGRSAPTDEPSSAPPARRDSETQGED